ncbi:hypothetical protein DRF68_18845 [Candidatus Chryseobacterium massiliae]|uniref:Uncharacterized protein n=1 Tax=Candidatus Chryseobacterium massiliense TaxID=204089 RepID=A0A3D9AJ07_9FLAO|nr:hypothetical protein DRF68_18845 [Candidatus Chryseobacterium massiliae]
MRSFQDDKNAAKTFRESKQFYIEKKICTIYARSFQKDSSFHNASQNFNQNDKRPLKILAEKRIINNYSLFCLSFSIRSVTLSLSKSLCKNKTVSFWKSSSE